jgi:hypothetical protein
MPTAKSGAQPLIISDPENFGENDFIAKDEWFQEKKIPQVDGTVKTVLPKPTFTVAEVSKVFFAEDPDWLRWRLKKTEDNPHGFFILDGEPLPDRRTDKNFRYYTLADVEKMAHALAQNGAISAQRLSHIVGIVRNMLKVWGKIA